MKLRYFLPLILSIAWFSVSVSQDTKENADFKLAVNLYNDKFFDLALEQFRQFVSTYPNTQQGIEARFYLGLCQAKQGKHDDARITFQNFALAFPDNQRAPEAWWNVAESYVTMKNLREAALAFERVKTFHPKSKLAPGALLRSGEYFELAGDPESARKVLRTITQDYSSSDVILPARLKLAQMYLSDNQFELCRAESKRVADAAKEPNLSAQALVLLARSLAGLGKLEEAQHALDDVAKSYRSTSSYYTGLLFLGSLQRQLGYAVQSFATWKLIDADSSLAAPQVRQQALIEIGDGYYVRGENSKALQNYEKAAAVVGRQRCEALYKAGLSAGLAGDSPKAFALLSKALADTSSTDLRGDILLAAARSAARVENHGEALRLYTLFQEQYPGDLRVPEVILDVARLYQDRLHNYLQAITHYDELINNYATSKLVDDALYGRAEAMRLSHDLDGALSTYEDLQKRYPSSEFVSPSRDAASRVLTFELKNKESGLEKLALLVGDVIAQRSKGELAYRLAEIYFHDLRDFAKAALQYASALRLGIPSENRVSAWYNMAKAFEYAAVQGAGKDGSPRLEQAMLAIAAYDSLVKQYPASEFADDAATSQLGIRLQLAAGATDVRLVSNEFLQSHQVLKRKDRVYYMIGEMYLKKKDPEDAAQSYGLALKERPLKDVEGNALYRLGEVLTALGRPDSAAAVYQQYIKKFPTHEFTPRAVRALARYESGRGNAAKALDLYKQLEQQFSYTSYSDQLERAKGDAYYTAGNFADAAGSYQSFIKSLGLGTVGRARIPLDVLYNVCTSYSRLGKREEAKRYYAEYLVRDDSSDRAGQAYYQLATIAREENNVALASQYLQRASQFSSSGSTGANRAAFEAAELYFKNEEYANAISRYNDVVEKESGDSLRQYLQSRIVVAYFRLNNAKEADTRAAAFIKSYPRIGRYAAEFDYERGMYFLRKDDYVSAKRFFDNVILQYPGTSSVPASMFGNARVAELSDKTPEAIKLYEGLIQNFSADPIAPRARLALGNLYYGQEQWDPAARQYKAILDSESRSPDLVQFAMNNLILAYKQLSLFDAALEWTRKYIDRFPDDPELLNKRVDIGVLYQKLGYYDQAILHLQSLLDNADAELEAEVRYYIGEAYFYKGDYQQAILEFLKVPYLVTKRTKVDWVATSYYMAGQSYEKMSKFDQAITMYKQIISRPGIDATFKTGAQREIDRVNALLKTNK
jgi:TolA-binding protein